MDNLPIGGGYPREIGPNTAYVLIDTSLLVQRSCIGPPMDGSMSYQVVGRVMAYQAYDG